MYRIVKFLILVCAFAQTSCSKDDEDVNLLDSVAKWKYEVNENTNITTSMTIVASFDNQNIISKGDVMACFVDGECRGVCSSQTYTDGISRFFLIVRCNNDEYDPVMGTQKDVYFEIRYYNDYENKIYYSEQIRFESDKQLGSMSSAFIPNWR